jgi:hypothetical protein
MIRVGERFVEPPIFERCPTQETIIPAATHYI